MSRAYLRNFPSLHHVLTPRDARFYVTLFPPSPLRLFLQLSQVFVPVQNNHLSSRQRRPMTRVDESWTCLAALHYFLLCQVCHFSAKFNQKRVQHLRTHTQSSPPPRYRDEGTKGTARAKAPGAPRRETPFGLPLLPPLAGRSPAGAGGSQSLFSRSEVSAVNGRDACWSRSLEKTCHYE